VYVECRRDCDEWPHIEWPVVTLYFVYVTHLLEHKPSIHMRHKCLSHWRDLVRILVGMLIDGQYQSLVGLL
jgi:hypothetical protein